MNELLFQINKALIGVNLLMLLVYLATSHFAQPGKSKSAFGFVLTLMCITSFTHYLIEFYARSLWANSESLYLGVLVWYFGFALSDFIFVYLSVLAIKKLKLLTSRQTNLIIFSWLSMGFLQVVRFADRYVLGTDALAYLYKITIPVLNCAITITIVLFVVKDAFLIINSRAWRVKP